MVLRRDVVEQLAVAAVLHDEEESVFRLDDFVELNNVGVPHDTQDVDLASHALDIVNVVDLPFVQDFDGHFLARENVVSLLHFTESALAKGLFDLVISDEFLTHIYYFFVLLTFYWYFYLRLVHAVLKLHESQRQVVLGGILNLLKIPHRS